MIWVWSPAWVREFTPLQTVQTQLWCLPSLLFRGCGLHFPWWYSSWGMEFTTHHHLVSRLWMSGTVLHALISWYACTWFYLYFKHVFSCRCNVECWDDSNSELERMWKEIFLVWVHHLWVDFVFEFKLFIYWIFNKAEFIVSRGLCWCLRVYWTVDKICWTLQKVIAVTEIEMRCMCILCIAVCAYCAYACQGWRCVLEGLGKCKENGFPSRDLNWDHLNTKQASWSARILIRFSIVFLSLSREISGLTHSPCSSVLLEKLPCSYVIKKFPAFYGTRRFIIALASAHHLSVF